MTAVIIPLGSESCWQNNELRYSLRSMEKHLTGFDEVVVVGDTLPAWLTGVTPVNIPDAGKFRSMNTLVKITETLKLTRADKFVLWYDDIFLTKTFNARSFPNYFKGNLLKNFSKLSDHSLYKQSRLITYQTLFHHGYTTHCFECHCPFVFNTGDFIRIMKLFPNRAPGYLYKSLYANIMKVHATKMNQLMLHEPLDHDQISSRIGEHGFFSIRDQALNEDLKQWLGAQYPDSSKFEND
jgi:hypothetical protein